MHSSLKTILCLLVVSFGFLGAAHVQAATKTVCGVGGGCDYSSLTEAFADSPAAGDVFQVGAGESPYAAAAETWPITFPVATTTVECVGGAQIGQPAIGDENRVYLSSGSTIQNCSLGYVQLMTASPHGAVSPSGIVIQNNTFATTVTSTIDFTTAGAVNFVIQDNTNINYLGFASSTDGIVQNNTFYGDEAGYRDAAIVYTSDTTGRIQFIGNTFTNYSAVTAGSMALIHLSGSDQTFASNTIRYAVNFPISASVQSSLEMNAAGTNYIGGNFIYSPNGTGCSAVTLSTVTDQAWSGSYTILHNTIYRQPYCTSGGSGVTYSTMSNRADVSMTMRIDYNLFYNASSTADGRPAVHFIYGALTSLSQSNAHNGIYNFGSALHAEVSGVGGGTDVTDATTIYTNPILRLSDADTSNDLEVAPFSAYLDVVGSQDIGATEIARRSTTYVDDTGTIDYETVDATSTSAIGAFLRTGDTVMLAAGTYDGFAVNSAHATSSITIQGVGAETIIEAGVGLDALTFTSVSSSHIADLVVTNAAGSSSAGYIMTNLLAHFGSTDYVDAFEMLGLSTGQLAIFTDSSTCDAGPPLTIVAADGDSVTAATEGGTTGFHLAAVQIMGSSITVLLPDSQFANQTALQSYLSGICGLPEEGFTVDAFADDLFTVSGGTYSYDSSSLVSSGMTLVSGVEDPPAITYTPGTAFAGIKFTGSSNNNTVSGVTSTNNGYGVRFASTGDSYNTISDSTFTGNTYYDVMVGGNAYNILDNDSFTRASSSVSGSGSLLVKYRARVHVTDTDGGGDLSGITASSTDAALTASSFGATGGSGYTSYLRLPAYVIDADGYALTNGGYNPYMIRTEGVVGYSAASSGSVTLSSPDQVFSIVAIRTLPASPSGITASDVATSTISVSWTDNATNNSVTLFDFANVAAGETFPTVYADELSENAIGTGLIGLQPNGGYRFRVAARNAGGTSAYDMSALYYLLADTPATPVVSEVSQTALSVVVPADANSTSTEYALYSSTLGGYLSGEGTVSPSATWQTSSTWSTLTVNGLTCGTSYTFTTIARNHDGIESTTSTAATATTSACTVVRSVTTSGGSGGGGGGGGGGAIQTFFIPAIPRIVPQTVASTTTVVSPQSVTTTVTMPDTTAPSSAEATLERFLREGTTAASRALGRGEREAVVRDLQEVLGVPAARILVSDLERVAGGQIPRTRNLAYERSMAPRALATFRTVFGHAPNFRNANENLAWNTLMYRIRFPRNLSSERQGIVAFRRQFRTTAQSPFQWAVVRVLGYIVR